MDNIFQEILKLGLQKAQHSMQPLESFMKTMYYICYSLTKICRDTFYQIEFTSLLTQLYPL